ncbi:MAG: zinc-dependent alcohol dehydrogenase family protein [Comamonas sp.]
MARIVRFHTLGGPEVLQFHEEPDSAALGADEVRIRVKAIGLNRADAMFRRGSYIEKAQLPSRLGYEAAGLIEAVGAGVTGLKVGDAVSVIPTMDLGRYGTYGETAVVPARFVALKPESLSFAQAASAWMQYITAYGGLIAAGGLRAGEHVLITAASSSVGLAAIQIALSVGAIPIATTLDMAKKDAVLALGAAHVIATRDEDLGEALHRIVGPDGLQRAFDAVGGPQVETIAAAMAPGGIIVSHGMLDPAATPFPLRLALRKSLTMRGYVFTEIVGNADKLEAAKRFILQGLSSGSLRPVVDKIFAFDDLVEAHRYLESNQQIGKIVVSVP